MMTEFGEKSSRDRKIQEVNITMRHVPGLEGQADWTGDHGHFTDLDTGEIIEVHV